MATSPSITPFFTAPYSFPIPIPTTAPMYARTTYLPPPPFGFGAPPYAPYNHPFPYFPTPIPSPYPYPPPAAAYAPPPGFFPTPAPVPVYAPTPADGTYSQIQVPESIAPATLGPQTTGTPASSFTSPDPTTSVPSSTSTTALGRPSLDCLHANDSDHTPEVTSAAASASVVFGTPASTTTTTPTPVFACAPAAEGLSFNLVDNKAAFHTTTSRMQGLAPVLKILDGNASSDDDDRKTDTVQRHATYRTTSVVFTPASGSTTKVASAPSMFSNTSAAASYLSSPFGPCFVVPAPILASVSATSEATRASIVPSVTAAVASKVFGEMPAQNSWHETHGITPTCYPGHEKPIQNSCVQSVSTSAGCQNLDELPQAYGLHYLICRIVVQADGTEHRYYALPGNYPLEQDTPEPLFSNEPVGVFASKPGQQPYKEEHQEGDRLLKCASTALETDHTGACLTVISDVRDFSLELQQQDDEKACNYSLLKASDSVVTSSSKLNNAHVLRGLRWLWDPGASTPPHSSKSKPFGELGYVAINVPKFLNSCNQVGTHVQQLKDPQLNVLEIHEREKEWDLFTAVDGNTQLQCTEAYKSEMIQMLVVPLSARRAPIFEPAIMCSYAFGLGWMKMKTAAVLVLAVPHSEVTHLANHLLFLLSHEQQLSKDIGQTSTYCGKTSELSFLSLTACLQCVAPKGINFVRHATCFILRRAAHLTQDNYLSSLYCKSVLQTSYVWDPGVKISLYNWLNILTIWAATDKQFSCTHIPDLAAWENQSVGRSASYIMDSSTMLLFAKEMEMVTLIHEQWSSWFNAMHYCRMF